MVTGLGIISPLGNSVSEAWDRALAGTPGISRITRFDPSRLASQIAGEVKGFDVAPYMITVVGEAPAVSVQRIADAVEFRRPTQ